MKRIFIMALLLLAGQSVSWAQVSEPNRQPVNCRAEAYSLARAACGGSVGEARSCFVYVFPRILQDCQLNASVQNP